jgi:hypothetical protein
MHRPAEATSPSLEYSTLRRRWPWKPYLLGVLTTPAAYLLLYVVLRFTGVFYTYYSQGSWEIEGGTGIYVIDMPFFPLAVMEGDLHNRLRWLREPTGG